MAPSIITVVGSLNSDIVTVTPRIPSAGETLTASSFFTSLGGKGANQAVACARLSRSKLSTNTVRSNIENLIVKIIGAVGADEFGPRIKSSIAHNDIDVSGVEVIDGLTTGVAVILVEELSGENRILLNPGANHALMAEDFCHISSLGNPVPDLIVLQLEIPLVTVLNILKVAKEASVDVLLNPAPAVELPSGVYQGLAHLILNESEAAILTGRSLEEVEQREFDWTIVINEFLKKGVRNVVVTLGAKGAVFASIETCQNIINYVPAARVKKIVDTTAAGDTFVGAYAVGIVRGEENLSNIIIKACKAAARTIEKKGALESIPWFEEIEQ